MGLTPGGSFCLDPFYRIRRIGQVDNVEVDRVVRFHLAADPVEVAVNRLIASPGVKPDGLAFGLFLDNVPAVGGTQRSGQQQTGQKRAKTHTAHNASLFKRRGESGKQPSAHQR